VLAGVHYIFIHLSVYIFVPWILFLLSYSVLPRGFKKIQLDSETSKGLSKQLTNFSFWLAVWSWSAIIASRIDQIMLSNLLGLEKVAIYAVALQFVYFYSLAIQSVSTVLIPKISVFNHRDQVRSFIMRSFKWILPVSILGALLIYPSQIVITLFFGHKYDASLNVYLILSYSMLLTFIFTPISLAVNVFNKTVLIALSGLIQFLVNLFLNLLLIPAYGVNGAALTFGVGILINAIYSSVCLVYLYKKVEIKMA
jgi:O-antigen/teichoic acid export membrane protein